MPDIAQETASIEEQMEAGMKYIKKVYGDPKSALQFWKATMRENPALAPDHLQNKATKWISKKYKGY